MTLTRRAAYLAKADLTTAMVTEFPELQGTMAMYYARHGGEDEAVARACGEHYQPRFAGDALPASPIGLALSLADKFEMLVGMWSVDAIPDGEKDPFALRRCALGILRMLTEKNIPLDLTETLQHCFAQFTILPHFVNPTSALLAFFTDRLPGLLSGQGYRTGEIEAVLNKHPTRLDDLHQKLVAVRHFSGLAESRALSAANKRIVNILKKSAAPAAMVIPERLIEQAEKALYTQLLDITPQVNIHLTHLRYTEALATLACLQPAIDAFFDQVMVNTENPALRDNRLALLAALHKQKNCIADISCLVRS